MFVFIIYVCLTNVIGIIFQAVDEHNVPGMDHVDSLAEYLVGLRTQTSLVLSNQAVSTILGLWQALLDYDKRRVVFSARHQDRLMTGKFKSPKKRAEFTPGVESTKRCAITNSGSPAQWPNCCRLMESIFVRLCQLHRAPKKKDGVTLTRWTLILRDYNAIRQLILANGVLLQDTTLQLVHVNQTTLIQWHNKRVARQDVSLLQQGIDLPPRISVAAESLPPSNVRPAVAPQLPGVEHSYHLPQSTAGKAQRKRKATATATATAAAPTVRPRLSSQRQLFPHPTFMSQVFSAPVNPIFTSPFYTFPPTTNPTLSPLVFAVPPPVLLQTPFIPPAPHLAAPAPKVRKRTGEPNCCRRCGQPKAQTGHSHYKGHVYCPLTEPLAKEQWLEKMRK